VLFDTKSFALPALFNIIIILDGHAIWLSCAWILTCICRPICSFCQFQSVGISRQ